MEGILVKITYCLKSDVLYIADHAILNLLDQEQEAIIIPLFYSIFLIFSL